jgi:hypothetical protein
VYGPGLLVASLVPHDVGRSPNRWQYHPRSDHHSKIACWGLLLDLLDNCALLREHAQRGLVGYGINHEMRDYRTARKKNLDLVVCRPRSGAAGRRISFAEQSAALGVVFDTDAERALARLPPLVQMPVGAVHVALEAKACMTAFGKARPRLYDELNSSHLAIHGNSPHTIAAGLAMVNAASRFLSPILNPFDITAQPPVWSNHVQPRDAASVIDKLRELPRRSRDPEEGYDALAIVVVDCRNDGTPVSLLTDAPAPTAGDVHQYEMAVHRVAQLYEQKFRSIA